MNTHADKTQENKSQSVSATSPQKQNGGVSAFQFEDNRPSAVAQRKLLEMANNSSQVSHMRAFQGMTNHRIQLKISENQRPRPIPLTASDTSPIQAKWIIKDGKRVWVRSDYELQEGEEHEGPIHGVGTSAPHLPHDPQNPLGTLPPQAMGRLVDMLGKKDLGNLLQVNKSTHDGLRHTGHQFMESVYQQPEKAIPTILPSVDDWAHKKGPPADPSRVEDQVNKMANLDPATKVGQGGRGKSAGTGHGFVATKLKMSGPLGNKTMRSTRSLLEYHPGGGVHSEAVAPSKHMGGSYIKVQRPKAPKKHDPQEKQDFRMGRFGSFGNKDRFWSPLGLDEEAGKGLALGATQVGEQGGQSIEDFTRMAHLNKNNPNSKEYLRSKNEAEGIAENTRKIEAEAKRNRRLKPKRYQKWRGKNNWQKLHKLKMITPKEEEEIRQEVLKKKAAKKQYFFDGRPGYERPDPSS